MDQCFSMRRAAMICSAFCFRDLRPPWAWSLLSRRAASCMVMVLAPVKPSRVRPLSKALPMDLQSTPGWLKNLLSSEAINALIRAGETWPMATHSSLLCSLSFLSSWMGSPCLSKRIESDETQEALTSWKDGRARAGLASTSHWSRPHRIASSTEVGTIPQMRLNAPPPRARWASPRTSPESTRPPPWWEAPGSSPPG